jgi:hypothetical protein
MIMTRRNQIEAQTEALASVAIALRKEAKDFQAPDDVFNYKPLFCQLPVLRLLLRCQGVQFVFLMRQTAIVMLLRQAQVPAIRQTLRLRQKRQSVLDEQPEVVHLARTETRGYDLLGRWVSDDLRFLGVTLLFAAVVASLFFSGVRPGTRSRPR